MLRAFPAGCLIRTWAFHDGAQANSHAIQINPGTYNEHALRALDWVVQECKLCRLRLLLTLTNYWPDYGGLQQYVRWSKGFTTGFAVLAEQFYTDVTAQAMFADYVSMLLQRTNTFTGTKYCEEDTIFGWDLINEPRCASSSGISPAAMRSWLAAAVSHLKTQAGPKQLVTIGLEGFWGESTPDLLRHNPYPATMHGCDWALEASIPGIDFLSFHMYPDHWLPKHATSQRVLEFTNSWVKLHGEYGRRIGKPVLLTEFGCKHKVCGSAAVHETTSSHQGFLDLLQQPIRACFKVGHMQAKDEDQSRSMKIMKTSGIARHEYVNYVFSRCSVPNKTAAVVDMQGCGSSTIQGALFWKMTDEGYPDYDGFIVHVPGTSSKMTRNMQADTNTRHDEEMKPSTWAVLQSWASHCVAHQ